ncbi:hypothetical protein SEVIR_8G096400v4 [Setaria viridis]|uniref:Uncharacterized protein n=1 Tax=Setaria viridis TaxID=4556 RepID=A0A4U6TFD2_SETVI|nr:hypothetical protein SEVIR_8G096400v2 [Setaria viridis]
MWKFYQMTPSRANRAYLHPVPLLHPYLISLHCSILSLSPHTSLPSSHLSLISVSTVKLRPARTMERWPARAASASCRRRSRCGWPHAGVWSGHEPRRLQLSIGSCDNTGRGAVAGRPMGSSGTRRVLLPLLMQLVRGW